MVSSTPSCRSRLEFLLAALLLAVTLTGGAARAADPEIRYAEVVLREDGYVVNADIELELNPRLEEAVNRGVALHFAAEFSIGTARWYWFDSSIVERRLEYRLSYHPITRSYRLSVGNLHRSFDTIEEALRSMVRIRNWQIAPADRLQAGVSYNAALRFLHDTSQLPKPFQVTAIGSRDWNLATDWMRWTFLASEIR